MARRTSEPASPTYSPFFHRLFAGYLRRYFARHFTAVRISRRGLPPDIHDRPIVFYSNHPSWWDPALYMLLGRVCYPGREGYGPMDATALEKYGFFRKLGVFGIEPGSAAGARRFLRVAEEVLARPGATLWMTAEGEFRDPRRRPVRLKTGLSHLVRRLPSVAAVPLAFEYPFWDERLPEALVRFGRPILIDDGATKPAREWHEVLENGLEITLDALAAESARRDAELFLSVASGRRGVGGVYDQWRRARALGRGEDFNPAHGDGS